MAQATSALTPRSLSLRPTRGIGDEQAQTLAEYAVILGVITLAIVAAVGLLASTLGLHFADIAQLVSLA